MLSHYKKQDVETLEHLEQYIINKYENSGDIIFSGDFNARTGNKLDYINGDSASHIPVYDAYIIDTAVGQRHSRDNTVDSRGKDLLELCIANKLRITNGRTFGDAHGKCTCHIYTGSSVVDFFIVSEQLLNDILYVYVSDFFTFI